MKIDTKGLQTLLAEASALSNKKAWTKADERRNAYLLSAIASVRSGATLAELDLQNLNDTEIRNGFRPTKLRRESIKTRAKALFLKKLWEAGDTRELRTVTTEETEGNLLAQIGTYTGLGNFVPTQFFDTVFHTMGDHDFLYDADKVTLRKTDKAGPVVIPTYSDLENVAIQFSEAANTFGDQIDIGQPGNVKLGSYSYRSPIHWMSLEVFDDMADTAGAYDTFATAQADRLARGISKNLLLGSGTGTTLGLIPALQAAGVSGVVATGNANNTGGAGTGVNSIGSYDLANLFCSVNASYRSSSKCGWAMNDTTLLSLMGAVTKMGLPLVNFENGGAYIYGKPVFISPNIPSIGSSAISVLFGDFSYWVTRLVGADARIQVYRETAVEQGLVGLQSFVRADGVYAFNDTNPANSPVNYLVQHS
jgi:HK97 family phage major capsid protein